MITDDFESINFPTVSELNYALITIAPKQEKFLRRRFSKLLPQEKRHLEKIATKTKELAGDNITKCIEDYVWWCGEQLQEELFFRRNKRYRRSTFKECLEEIYCNDEFMTKYMNGLLFTQVWWSNHTQMFAYYLDEFLPLIVNSSSHLEIGPGHGLFLYFACDHLPEASIESWDVSASSLEMAQHGLKRMGIKNMPELRAVDIMEPCNRLFDSIVMSEVLEHLEEPSKALKQLNKMLSKEGRLFINMPINSPAPDHLFNMDTPEELTEFIRAAGFQIESEFFAPVTNYTLETCKKKKLTISCGYILKHI